MNDLQLLLRGRMMVLAVYLVVMGGIVLLIQSQAAISDVGASFFPAASAAAIGFDGADHIYHTAPHLDEESDIANITTHRDAFLAFDPETHRLNKRLLPVEILDRTDPIWLNAVQQGKNLLCQLGAAEDLRDDQQPVQSQFVTYNEFEANRWGKAISVGGVDLLQTYGSFWRSIGASDADADNPKISWKHYGTQGSFQNVYNPKAKVILAMSNWSPAAMQADEPVEDQVPLPELRAWSDVTFLEWEHQCQLAGTSVKDLRFVQRSSVVNIKSRRVAKTALAFLQRSYEKFDLSPEMSMDLDAAAAILGTPNGKGVAWLLLQHKQQFGPRFIQGVTVYKGDSSDDDDPEEWALFNFLFRIESPTPATKTMLSKWCCWKDVEDGD
ncbi:hypothetical protein K402DRAFT_455568 [Aulographum hederae CBS 113979]|uniref:Transmembrane protein n=1 Tax=Aulographum hederae CBS 113979 TaxID=1176131 RepID=A0A6G1GUN4_9PEZI|nr:hypothetical protein K402DRAFT_455568 [Aulographum hederae CBS 113979]